MGGCLWWLSRNGAGPSVVILRQGDNAKQAASEKFRAWFKADVGLQRVYPWILFGPYVVLVAWRFPLERTRMRLNLPLNLATGALFVAASHGLNIRLSKPHAKVVVVTSQPEAVGLDRPAGTNLTFIQVIRSESPDFLEQELPGDLLPSPTPFGLSAPGSSSNHPAPARLNQSLASLEKPPAWPGRLGVDVLGWVLDMLAYSAIIGLAHSVFFYRRLREREHRAVVLEATLANAQLSALKAQLQPHFLFNSLNAITTLLRRDPHLAEASLLSLSDLLRLALSQSEQQEIALREELNLVQRYLEIQQTRFGDKLRVEQDIEPETLECRVPTLLLQPLVENALQHGLEPCEHAGLVRLTARRRDAVLVLTVQDDGVGLAEAAPTPAGPSGWDLISSDGSKLQSSSPRMKGNGIGLRNLRARLQTLYGTRQRLVLAPRPGGGVCVEMEIPWSSPPRAKALSTSVCR